MADNSMMGNVSQVEQYGKSLNQVQQQMREIFKRELEEAGAEVEIR